MRPALMIAAVLAVLLAGDACLAGLGEPVSARSPQEAARALKSSQAYRQAQAALRQKGYSSEQADAALSKMPEERLALLAEQAASLQSGGVIYFWDFFFFLLLVGLIVYLIIVLMEAPRYRYRRYR